MEKGQVIKSTGSWYSVKIPDGRIISSRVRGKLKTTTGIRSTNPVAVGDWVDFEIVEDGTGLIMNLHERKNYIIRKSTNLSKESHIIAANIDRAFLMVTIAWPQTTTYFIDRYLVSAEAYRIPVVLIVNKIDLYNQKQEDQLEDYLEAYEKAGYTCIQTSVKENINVEEMKPWFKDNVSLISGHSGVGKSSLLNAMDPGLNLKIQELSKTHKTGKHTTTFAEMFPLSFGGYIIDTPGIKAFGLVDIDKEEIYHFFPEIFSYSKYCKFYNCTHIHEPGCAVRQAADEGNIAESRYINYLRMMEEEENKYR